MQILTLPYPLFLLNLHLLVAPIVTLLLLMLVYMVFFFQFLVIEYSLSGFAYFSYFLLHIDKKLLLMLLFLILLMAFFLVLLLNNLNILLYPVLLLYCILYLFLLNIPKIALNLFCMIEVYCSMLFCQPQEIYKIVLIVFPLSFSIFLYFMQ